MGKLLVLLWSTLVLQGCQTLFFWPSDSQLDSPRQFHFDYLDVWLDTTDGETLHSWWIPADPDKSARGVALAELEQTSSKGVIYVLHGNAQNLTYHVTGVHWLADAGFDVFILDYRGYGASTGQADFDNVTQDALTGYNWLLQHYPAQQIIVLGQSLGGAVAANMVGGLATQSQPAGLILDSTFVSHRKVFRQTLHKSPVLWAFQYPLSWMVTDEYAPDKSLGQIACPTLVVHSQADPLSDASHAEEIYARLRGQQKELWLHPTASHMGIWLDQTWRERLLCQLERWPALGPVQGACQPGSS